MWSEEGIPINFKENLFGGLCQNTLECTCGYTEVLQVHPLPAVIPVQISEENIQKCFESYFLSETVDWKCPKCAQLKIRKHSMLITEPEVLILQLMRYKFDDREQLVKKVHQEVLSPPTLILQSGKTFSLHSIINHIGENTQSGHYNHVLFEPDNNKCILVDDESISFVDNYQEKVKAISYISIYIAE